MKSRIPKPTVLLSGAPPPPRKPAPLPWLLLAVGAVFVGSVGIYLDGWTVYGPALLYGIGANGIGIVGGSYFAWDGR